LLTSTFVLVFFMLKKMKTGILIRVVVVCSLIGGLLLIASITGMLQSFSIPTPSNEPNVKKGDRVYASSLGTPELYDFIVFTNAYADSVNSTYMPGAYQSANYLFRLCGVPGSTIEMKNGILYVNKNNFDSVLNLTNNFKISNTAFYAIEPEDNNRYETLGQMISNDTAIVSFDADLVKKYGPRFTLVPYMDTTHHCFTWHPRHGDWTVDNFGPLKIPANSYFVLGDNRHNAMDSRYIGFVKKENIKGVVLNK